MNWVKEIFKLKNKHGFSDLFSPGLVHGLVCELAAELLIKQIKEHVIRFGRCLN